MPTTAKPKIKSQPIAVAMSTKLRAKVERAAAQRKQPVDRFVADAASRMADAVLNADGPILLTKKDSEFLISLLESPPPPLEKLREAMQAHKRYTRG